MPKTIARGLLAMLAALCAAPLATAQNSKPYTKEEREWQAFAGEYIVCKSESRPGVEGFLYYYPDDRAVLGQISKGSYLSSASIYKGFVLSETYPEDVGNATELDVFDGMALNLRYSPAEPGMYYALVWKTPARMKTKDLKIFNQASDKYTFLQVRDVLDNAKLNCRVAEGLYTKPKPDQPQPSHKPDPPPPAPKPPSAAQVARDAETRRLWIASCTQNGDPVSACGCFDETLKKRLNLAGWEQWSLMVRGNLGGMMNNTYTNDSAAIANYSLGYEVPRAMAECGVHPRKR